MTGLDGCGKSHPLPGFDPRTLQPVPSRYNGYAIPACNRNDYQEYFLGSKGGRCVWLTTLPPSCADCREIWEPQPPGNLRAVQGLLFSSFIFVRGMYEVCIRCNVRNYINIYTTNCMEEQISVFGIETDVSRNRQYCLSSCSKQRRQSCHGVVLWLIWRNTLLSS